MDDLNVEAVARKAMLAGAADPVQPAPPAPSVPSAPAPSVPSAPAQPKPAPPAAPKVVAVVTAPEAAAAKPEAPAAPAAPALPVPSVASIKQMLGHTLFRLAFVYAAACVILISLNPPFVQVRSRKKRNALEAAPCSYYRVMVAAAVITAIVGVAPLVVQHRAAIGGVCTRIQGMIKLP